jgi:tetratricopeptide (TPR) repeat protein
MKIFFAIVLGLSIGSAAQAAEELGTVDFPTTCQPVHAAQFNRGVALLHDFWYDEAERQFKDILKADPACAMAHWGIAMSRFHQIWDRPDAATLALGRKELKAALAKPAKSARERAYVAALNEFFAPPKAKFEARIAAYARAMNGLHRKYPRDVDAAAFDALARLAAEPTGDTSLSAEHQALEILKPWFVSHPDHPGVVHYIIHACDTPSLATAGLAAAQRYGHIAPSGAHAAHMPGHIFARLGLWKEDIDANVASVAASESAQSRHPGEGFDEFHANEFLLYAYLQSGQEVSAKQVLDANDELLTHIGSMPSMMSGGMSGMFSIYRSEFPAFYFLELRDWKSAAALPVDATARPNAQRLTLWARIVAAGHLHDAAAANADLARFQESREQQKRTDQDYDPNSTGAQVVLDEVLAWSAYANGDVPGALQHLRQSADLQDKVGQGEVDIPAREMLADMLLELNRPKEALSEYELALSLSPKRFNGLFNAGMAAEAAGDRAKASAYYAELLKATDNGAQSSRVEFKHVADFKPGAGS